MPFWGLRGLPRLGAGSSAALRTPGHLPDRGTGLRCFVNAGTFGTLRLGPSATLGTLVPVPLCRTQHLLLLGLQRPPLLVEHRAIRLFWAGATIA